LDALAWVLRWLLIVVRWLVGGFNTGGPLCADCVRQWRRCPVPQEHEEDIGVIEEANGFIAGRIDLQIEHSRSHAEAIEFKRGEFTTTYVHFCMRIGSQMWRYDIYAAPGLG
jgi:hypothetical protein